MKNVAKYAAALAVVAVLWYAIVGVRVGTEPIQGGWLIKWMVDYHQR